MSMEGAQKIIRAIFLLFALCIFIFQMKQSVEKYLDPPILQRASIAKLKDIEAPKWYICQADSFNFNKMFVLGYMDIFTGRLVTGGSPTWKGKHGNLTYSQILKESLEYNYTSLKAENAKIEDGEIFLFPSGYCKILTIDPSKTAGIIETRTKIRLTVNDPRKINLVRTEETPNARLVIGPVSDELFEWARVEITYELHDSSLSDGITCIDYQLQNKTTYGNCIIEALHANYLDVIGCFPPWMSGVQNSGKICEDDLPVKEINVTSDRFMSLARDQLSLLSVGRVEAFHSCLPPCHATNIRLRVLDRGGNLRDAAMTIFTINENVQVLRDFYGYDGFSLLVDLGSSLGLWLGLSAVSFLDFSFQTWKFVRAKVALE